MEQGMTISGYCAQILRKHGLEVEISLEHPASRRKVTSDVEVGPSEKSQGTHDKRCPYCEGSLVKWGDKVVRCVKCQRNFSSE